MNPTIAVKSRKVYLEITDRCYRQCSYCAVKHKVGPKKAHVPIDISMSHVNWIAANTDAQEIQFLGGEPLLHPDLDTLIDDTEQVGIYPTFISAGVSANHKNTQRILDLYAQGRVDVRLSYQYGCNDQDYTGWLGQLKDLSTLRNAALRDLANVSNLSEGRVGILRDKQNRVGTTYTVDPSQYETVEEFARGFCVAVDISGYKPRVGSEAELADFIGTIYSLMKRSKPPFETSENHTIPLILSTDEGIQHHFRLNPAMTLTLDAQGHWDVYRAKGSKDMHQQCPATTSSYDSNIEVPILGVNSDGEVVFPTPCCSSTNNLFGSVDELTSPALIQQSFERAIQAMQEIIIQTKARSAKSDFERCHSDPEYPEGEKQTCTSCYFPSACNTCASLEKEDLVINDLTRLINERIDEENARVKPQI